MIMFGYDVFGSPVTFNSDFYDIDPDNANGKIVNIKWYPNQETYWWDRSVIGGRGNINTGKKTAAEAAKFIHEDLALTRGMGVNFVSLSETDGGSGEWVVGDGTSTPSEPPATSPTNDVEPCDDPNRETKSDGSCASSCKSGYAFDANNLCVAVETEEEESDGLPWGTIGFFGGIGLLALTVLRS